MMNYKDKTFCASPNCKDECGRQLTDEIRQGARASKMMLSVAYFCDVPPEAYNSIKDNESPE